jgi:hypothetical protein
LEGVKGIICAGSRPARGFKVNERNLPFTGLTKRLTDLFPDGWKVFSLFDLAATNLEVDLLLGEGR